MKIIDRWPQSLTFAGVGGVAAEVAMNSTVDLNASSSRGLPVSTVTSGSIASISGNTVSFSGTGQVTIEASQDGNSTVAAAAPISHTFRVKRPVTLSLIPLQIWAMVNNLIWSQL